MDATSKHHANWLADLNQILTFGKYPCSSKGQQFARIMSEKAADYGKCHLWAVILLGIGKLRGMCGCLRDFRPFLEKNIE